MAIRNITTLAATTSRAAGSSAARPYMQAVRNFQTNVFDNQTQAVSELGAFSGEARATSQKINDAFAIEAPFASIATRVGDLAEPLMEALLEAKRNGRPDPKDIPLYMPDVPLFCPVSRWASNSEVLRQVLVVDAEKEPLKPRMSWYHPDDRMIPRGWFNEGIVADMHYYFGDVKGLPDTK